MTRTALRRSVTATVLLATACGEVVVEAAADTDAYCANAEVVFAQPDTPVEQDVAEAAFDAVVADGPAEHRPTWEALDQQLDEIDPSRPSVPIGVLAYLQVVMDEEIYPYIRSECGFEPLRIFTDLIPNAPDRPSPPIENDDHWTSTIGRLDIECQSTGGESYEIVVESEHEDLRGDLIVTAVLYETEDAFGDGESFDRVEHEFLDLQPGEVRTTSATTDGALVGYCTTAHTFTGRSTD